MGNNKISQTISNTSGVSVYHLRQAYDELNRLRAVIGAQDHTTTIKRDAAGNVISQVDPRQHHTRLTYDKQHRLTSESTGGTTWRYDKQGRLTSVRDGNYATTTYQYDAFDNVISRKSPDTGITTYRYDTANNLIEKTDNHGQVSTYTYDALNRLIAVNVSGAPEEDVRYGYDNSSDGNYGIGRLTHIEDASGRTDYRYDYRGNIIEKRHQLKHLSQALTLSYQYNLADQLITLTHPSGLSVHYAYDNQGRVEHVSTTQPGQRQKTIANHLQYLPFGPLSHIHYGNGLTTTHTFDHDYRLRGITTDSPTTSLVKRRYAYDPNGNIVDLTDIDSPLVDQHFRYDVRNRVTQGEGEYGTLTFTYDRIGNRLNRQHVLPHQPRNEQEQERYHYQGQSNRLAGITTTARHQINDIRGERTLTYNKNGSPTAVTDTTLPDAQHSYNAARRLAEIQTETLTARYTYNALGQRTSKSVTENGQTTTTYFLYDEQGMLIAEINGAGQTMTHYLSLNHQPLAQLRGSQIYYYHNDHLGTPQHMTDDRQAVVWHASYLPFGLATLSTEKVENNLRFAGQYFDKESGLHYNYFRYYDPSLGRYLQSDPIGLAGGINTYAYVSGNPFNQPNNSISTISLFNHGSKSSISLTNNNSILIDGFGSISIIDSNFKNIGNLVALLKPKLKNNSFIDIRGCNTANGNNSLASMLSSKLPSSRVQGFSSYGVNLRLFGTNIGWGKTFQNGSVINSGFLVNGGTASVLSK